MAIPGFHAQRFPLASVCGVAVSRIALVVEYEGFEFHGWQSQKDASGVQDTLEAALARVANGPVSTVAAGRTDAGVHGLGQVVHFDPPTDRPLRAWVEGVNALLPPTVVVLKAIPVPGDFHARRDAVARTYLYRLLSRPTRLALGYRHLGWSREPLNAEAMHAAAQSLLGQHDFSAFRAAGCRARHPVRELQAIEIRRYGEEIKFIIRANAFLYNMVRIIVASLLEVGRGTRQQGWIAEVLESRTRPAVGSASPQGLYLAAVHYPPGRGAPEPPSSYQWEAPVAPAK